MAEPKYRQMMFSVPEGGEVTIFYPEPMTPATIAMVEELCSLWFRGLHRRALREDQAGDAEAEYASWFPLTPGVRALGEDQPSQAQLDAAWLAFQSHPVDHVEDSDAEQRKCVDAAVRAAHGVGGNDGR